MRRTIGILGVGRLGTALARRLTQAGYRTPKISRQTPRAALLKADVIWFCVPDSEIAQIAKHLSRADLKGKIAFHSSGVLTSEALAWLRKAGAAVASVHPLMTFVPGSVPKLAGVPFAVEGDRAAVHRARQIVSGLGANPVSIAKRDKVRYHAFATMICPLLVSLLAASEKVAALARIPESEARERMMPILHQTLRNYGKLGAAGAFSGPIVRGDVETIRAHLEAMKNLPETRNAYAALARAALKYLPSRNRERIARLLGKVKPSELTIRRKTPRNPRHTDRVSRRSTVRR
jgi:predicted short-subunit dehydrogenase-like oxidoreductase (DUF2520 family)